MRVKALYKNARLTPKKGTLVARMLRGKTVDEALTFLKFANKKAAEMLLKVLKSAIANAAVKKIDQKTLKFVKVSVSKGIVYKRWKPVSRGRAHAFEKKNSHIVIELEGEEKKVAAKKAPAKTTEKQEDKSVKEAPAKKIEAKTEEKKTETKK